RFRKEGQTHRSEGSCSPRSRENLPPAVGANGETGQSGGGDIGRRGGMERVPVGAAVALRGGQPGTTTCDPWEWRERLGTGGFGNVSLYQHRDLKTKIAIKSCRLELSLKNKDRWCHEIQIMKKLNHPNVVKACDVPEEMNFLVNDVPLLAMEYCCGGDLRKLLNKPENCCGLKESQILSLLSDIGSGIQYLHENRIIHRDLKPENIVLQDEGGKIIYKIIDLGYAKDLDQGTLCTSFVGTLQYLAPELFDNKPYTTTVDFWSFGTVVFECIAGFRPFLHNQQPFTWHEKIKKKDPKLIFAWEEMTGEVKFSAHLPNPNSLCRSLSECVNYIVQDSKIQLPIVQLQKIWAEAVHYVIGLKEDYSRLFQGQRAAMLSLLRYNANLTKMKNNMVSASQQLKAKLKFFQQSIHLDLERYSDQMTYGISSEKMLKAWKEMEEKALHCEQAGDICYLDEQIMALHTEIVELQRSPHARRQGDLMENLKLLGCKQKIIDLLPKIEVTLNNIKEADNSVMQMQGKRQREIWHLLKIACTQSSAKSPVGSSGENTITPSTPAWLSQTPPGNTLQPIPSVKASRNEAPFAHLIDENFSYLENFSTIMQEAKHEQNSSMM
ncbi:hypothetical protein lerEdw1_013238, partial [Lerista edwardsae]